MQVMIAVSTEDIRQGKPRMCVFCPIGLAMKRTLGSRFPGATFLASTWTRIVGADLDTIEFRLPVEASRFMHDFDKGLAVEPFTFVIDLPDAALEAN